MDKNPQFSLKAFDYFMFILISGSWNALHSLLFELVSVV